MTYSGPLNSHEDTHTALAYAIYEHRGAEWFTVADLVDDAVAGTTSDTGSPSLLEVLNTIALAASGAFDRERLTEWIECDCGVDYYGFAFIRHFTDRNRWRVHITESSLQGYEDIDAACEGGSVLDAEFDALIAEIDASIEPDVASQSRTQLIGCLVEAAMTEMWFTSSSLIDAAKSGGPEQVALLELVSRLVKGPINKYSLDMLFWESAGIESEGYALVNDDSGRWIVMPVYEDVVLVFQDTDSTAVPAIDPD